MLLSFTADVTLHDMSLASSNRNYIAFDSQLADASSLFKKGLTGYHSFKMSHPLWLMCTVSVLLALKPVYAELVSILNQCKIFTRSCAWLLEPYCSKDYKDLLF